MNDSKQLLNLTDTIFASYLLQKYPFSVLTKDEVALELQVDLSDVEALILNGDLLEKDIGDKKRITLNSLICFLDMNYNSRPAINKNEYHLLSDLLDEVLNKKRKRCKKLSSYKWYCNISKHIYSGFNNCNVEEITTDYIDDFLHEMVKGDHGKQKSHKFMLAVTLMLKSIFNLAVKKGYIPNSPVDSLDYIPYGKPTYSKQKALPQDTVTLLLAAIEKSRTFKPLIVLLLFSGLRIGEALALSWEDIDYTAKIIHVRKGLSLEFDEDAKGSLINKRYEIGDTKTVCSIRDVPVDNEVIKALIAWKKYVNMNQKLQKKIHDNHTEKIIFINRYGKIRSYQALRSSFQRFLRENHLTNFQITFHSLRHTYATLLQDAGVDINVIRDLLGHADIETTANIYVNVNMEPKIRARDKLSRTINQKFFPR